MEYRLSAEQTTTGSEVGDKEFEMGVIIGYGWYPALQPSCLQTLFVEHQAIKDQNSRSRFILDSRRDGTRLPH